jgi:hypothetical protein
MSEKTIETKQANLLAEIEAKQAAIDAEAIERLNAVEAEHHSVAADLAAREAKLSQEKARLEAEYGPKRAALQRARELTYKKGRVDTTRQVHAEAIAPADEAHDRVIKARQEHADALAAFWPLELRRVETGEDYKGAVRQLNEVEPGGAEPTVDAKRLADHRPDATEQTLRDLAIAAHPAAEEALRELQAHRVWEPPHYAYVMGVRTLSPR